jgi:uncharacterized membrane protein YheB (UPF0754 family)
MIETIRSFAIAVLADFRAHLWVYLSMPVIAALVGYVTKMVALEMMFRPMDFVGIRPWFGWQGIIPRKSAKMAGTAVDLMTARLIKPDELVRRLDPERILSILEQPLLGATEDLVRDIGERYLPGVWLSLPQFARQALVRRVQKEIPGFAHEVWQDVVNNFERYFDVKHMLVSNLVKDRELLNEIFRKVGRKEFVFFRNAGFFFGFGLGVVQLVCWLLWHQHWLMPGFGAFVGFLSDWIALQMLFRPLRPTRIWRFTVQGKFLARQQEVARDYAELIAKQLVTPSNIIEELLRGPFADRLVDLVQRHVKNMTDEQLGMARPLVLFAFGSERYMEMRRFSVDRVMQLLPETSKRVEAYAVDALDIKNTLVERMGELTPEEFEGMLRPAFKEDEKSLILVGGALGFLIGELQIQLML